jgi:hypothetical protein
MCYTCARSLDFTSVTQTRQIVSIDCKQYNNLTASEGWYDVCVNNTNETSVLIFSIPRLLNFCLYSSRNIITVVVFGSEICTCSTHGRYEKFIKNFNGITWETLRHMGR